ncbi:MULTISPECIES: WhiB family transcriptional regulator [unclassified Streptomyces]|jgi:WhiB family redox-sensing transcriptional regulator|uniref:WhiB family transcriptional regulator n=1 Tax=unclassified Streptomyces TaxID=2593676 RepID=UPI000A1FDA2A|nr:WhiB family transcriptional regulator [Streptomyces sp. 13-12-16]OSP28098.1 transcription factor WhiB [Streptomyces sp. 13-12-16]
MDWRDRGLCLREDPDLFFPIGSVSSGQVVVQTDEAKSVCRRCPVTEQCLAWAVLAGPVEGIWGGTTEGERRAARRRAVRRRTTAGTAA